VNTAVSGAVLADRRQPVDSAVTLRWPSQSVRRERATAAI